MYFKKFYILLLCIAIILLGYFFFVNNKDQAKEEGPLNENFKKVNVMLLPLDDRPANTYVPIQAGKSGGLNVITPPIEALGNFTTPGNVQDIKEWVLENGDLVDGFVISADMLAYGGLVASRTAEGQTLDEAIENLSLIKKLNDLYPEKPLFVFDTIQRLTVTPSSQEYLQYYDQVREWAIIHDEVHNLGKKELSSRLEELEKMIPTIVLDDYKSARSRNNKINHMLIDWVNSGYIDYLVLSQDDASSNGLHRKEREGLFNDVKSLDIEEKVAIFPGADEVDIVLISRIANHFYRTVPTFYIDYSGFDGADWIAPFEDIPFDENVEKHILAAGGSITQSSDEADIQLLVHTLSGENQNFQKNLSNFIGKIGRLISQGKSVAVADVLYYKSDKQLVDQLKKQGYLHRLHSYAAWNTAGNTVGFVIGHSGIRTSFLSNQKSNFDEDDHLAALQANLQFILHRIVKDYSYKNDIIEASRKFVADIGADQWNLGDDYAVVNGFVKEKIDTEGLKIIESFFGETYYLGIINGEDQYAKLEELEELYSNLPWPRLFEAQIEPEISLTKILN